MLRRVALIATGTLLLGMSGLAAQDYTLPPLSGEIKLADGFVPDPHTTEVQAGGPIALGASALDGRPRRTLPAPLHDHCIEVGLLDLDIRHVERQIVERLQRELGIDHEGRAISEVLAAGRRSSVDFNRRR